MKTISFRRRNRISGGIKSIPAQVILHVLLWLTVFLVLFPFLITIMFSLKGVSDFDSGFWTLPSRLHFENFSFGFSAVMVKMVNSLIVCLITAIVSILLASFSSYVFTRYDFYGKEFLFILIISVMIIPSVISLTPAYLNIQELGLNNTWLAVILPGVTGSQVGSIFLFRTFMGQHPKEMYESIDIDGGGDFIKFFYMSVPLSIPIMIIQFLGVFTSVYNDYLWPMLVISKDDIQLLMPALQSAIADALSETSNPGVSYAMYLVCGIPLLFTSLIGMKYFISGDFAAGMKL